MTGTMTWVGLDVHAWVTGSRPMVVMLSCSPTRCWQAR
jgi:hypothetical protein